MAANYDNEKASATGFDNVAVGEKDAVRGHSIISLKEESLEHAYDGENQEHAESFWQAVKDHPMACAWAFSK